MICIMSSMFRHFHTFIRKHFGCSSFKKHILSSTHIFACYKLPQCANYFLEIISNLVLVMGLGIQLRVQERFQTDCRDRAGRGGPEATVTYGDEMNVTEVQCSEFPCPDWLEVPISPSERGVGRKQVSTVVTVFQFLRGLPSESWLISPSSPHPTPSEERGRGAEKHLAQVQES